MLGRERQRRVIGKLPPAGLVEVTQDLHRLEQGRTAGSGPEPHVLQEGRDEPAQRSVTFGGADQRFLDRQGGQGVDLRLGGEHLPPANLGVDPVENVAAIDQGLIDGADHAAEQAHELADLAAAGLVLALATAAALGEQRSDHLVEHVGGCVAEATFQEDQLRHHGRPPPRDAVAAE